jgi:hypothetical protein
VDQTDLYFAGDFLKLLNSYSAEFASEKRLRLSGLLFSGNDNFGEVTFDSRNNRWEFNSPIDESNYYTFFDFDVKTMISADEHEYINNIVRILNQSVSPPVASYAHLETPRTLSFEILDYQTVARIGSIHYNAKESKYEFRVARNIVFSS